MARDESRVGGRAVRPFPLIGVGLGLAPVLCLGGVALAAAPSPTAPSAAQPAPPGPSAAQPAPPAPPPAMSAGPGSPPAPPSLTPIEAASDQALQSLLPDPDIGTNPVRLAFVNLPTWLWVDESQWQAEGASLSVDGTPVSAFATPRQVVWDMGDGGRVTCNGPGVPYDPGMPQQAQQTDCEYTYKVSSAGQPSPDADPNDDAFDVRATILWQVTWSTPAGQGVGIQPLATTSGITMRVEQIESIGSVQ